MFFKMKIKFGSIMPLIYKRSIVSKKKDKVKDKTDISKEKERIKARRTPQKRERER